MTASGVVLAPRFCEGSRGKLFIHVVAPAQGPVNTVVIMLPPIGEEMNKSRRMYSMQAHSLAEHGHVVVLPDLYGLGDSEGSVENATLNLWRSDLAYISNLVIGTWKPKTVHVIALRSAALLCDFVNLQLLPVRSLALWSPVINGSRVVKDMFRQALINARNQGDAKITVKVLREQTMREGFIEISGYRMSAELIDQLDTASLLQTLPPGVRANWFDVRAGQTADVSSPAPPPLTKWQRESSAIDHQFVEGPPFWRTAEISTVPELIKATTTAILEAERG